MNTRKTCKLWLRIVLIWLMGCGFTQSYATIYSNDPTLSDFTDTVTEYATFINGGNLFNGSNIPTSAILNAVNYPRVVVFNGTIDVSFTSATANIVVFDNIDHLGYGWDVFQYKISGSNDGTNFTPLFDPQAVNEPNIPNTNAAFTLQAWSGTAPTLLNNTLTPGLGSIVGNIGYEEYFTFSNSYQYFRFAPSSLTLANPSFPNGENEIELSAVGIAVPSQQIIATAVATITVNKDFIPNNAATVPVALTCTSGTVTTTPLNASEATPAVFTVTGASLGATCTATETVPSGYTANQTGCVDVALDGSCTITNTLIPPSATITVNKDFIPNNAATVPVALTCTSGTVTTTPLNASEATPAVFTVTGASPGATCTATETVPSGYTANQTGCAAVALDGSCTITNTLVPPSAVTAIPTLSEWGMILLAGVLGLFGMGVVRRRM
jgi:predicted secreted protein